MSGRTTRLIVSMPPRHGKSELVSKYFPAWFLGTFPDRRLILTSYEADYAASWGRKARNLLEESGHELFGIRVANDSSAADRWDLKGHAGGMNTAGAGGPITGKGGNIIIVDDPVKNDADARSETKRTATWDWYRATLRTRLQGEPGAIIVVMTRWHEDDLAGRLLAEAKAGGEHWTTLTLPAIAEDGDPLGRPLGAPLCPALFSAADLAALEASLGSYFWAALYQQRPAPADGDLLKRDWWRYYQTAPPAFDLVLQSWDMAFKDTAAGSYVVGQVWGKRGADCYLLDQVRARLDFPATLAAVQALTVRWPHATLKLVEDKANGPAVIASLQHELPGLVAVKPDGSKEARAAAVSPLIEAGNVYLPDPRRVPWVAALVDECTAFPNGVHDDQVDALSQALRRLSLGSAGAPVAGGQRTQLGPPTTRR